MCPIRRTIAFTLADPGPVEAAIGPAAMVVRGAFHPAPEDGTPEGVDVGTLVLLGWTGGLQWPQFASSPEAGDGRPDPLNRWTRRLLAAGAAALGGSVLYPGDGPPYWPFQRWAMRAEGIGVSPLGLLIHSRWGLWHAYRGALMLHERLALVAREAGRSPCAGCARPCLTACPVGAFPATALAVASYDTGACGAHLAGGGGCMESGCLARLACPVQPPVPYAGEQQRFHMQALRRGLKWTSQ